MTVTFTIYYCTALKGDFFSSLIKWYLRLTTFACEPLTHVFVEANGIIFEYTMQGLSTFTTAQDESMKSLLERAVIIQEIPVEGITSDEVYDNALLLTYLKPMSLWNFIRRDKYICTDIFFQLLSPTHKPQNMTPAELLCLLFRLTNG